MRQITLTVASMIIGAGLIGFLAPRQTVQTSPAEVGHLYSVSAGLVHRERALLETLNKKGYLTANEATKIRQAL